MYTNAFALSRALLQLVQWKAVHVKTFKVERRPKGTQLQVTPLAGKALANRVVALLRRPFLLDSLVRHFIENDSSQTTSTSHCVD